MRFSVHPAECRRESTAFCVAAVVLGLLDVILAFYNLYWGKHVEGVAVLAFVVSVMLAIVAWRACSTTLRSYEYVEISPDGAFVTLRGATGKVVRTFCFPDIRAVRAVNLPTIRYVGSIPSVRKQQCICVSTAMSETRADNTVACDDIRKSPNCIVFAYDEYAYQILQSAVSSRKTENAD